MLHQYFIYTSIIISLLGRKLNPVGLTTTPKIFLIAQPGSTKQLNRLNLAQLRPTELRKIENPNGYYCPPLFQLPLQSHYATMQLLSQTFLWRWLQPYSDFGLQIWRRLCVWRWLQRCFCCRKARGQPKQNTQMQLPWLQQSLRSQKTATGTYRCSSQQCTVWPMPML